MDELWPSSVIPPYSWSMLSGPRFLKMENTTPVKRFHPATCWLMVCENPLAAAQHTLHPTLRVLPAGDGPTGVWANVHLLDCAGPVD